MAKKRGGLFGWLLPADQPKKRGPKKPIRALAPIRRTTRAVGDNDAEKQARAWERKLRKAAGRDARYTADGLRFAAHHNMDHAALARNAARLHVTADQLEFDARLNVASIASVPFAQISRRTREGLLASAGRGEDSYAYPPVSLDKGLAEWNMWHRGRRLNIRNFEEDTGGVVESRQPRRLGPGGR